MAVFQMNILSAMLGTQVNFTVFMPSCVPAADNAGMDYDALYPCDVRFRTLWLIGSEYGDDSEAVRNTSIARYAQEHNIAVVMPCTNNRLYTDEEKGQKFLRHITDELWTVCTGMMAISPRREDNYIGGISLGAYAALKAALHAPEKYSKVLMMGGAFGKDLEGTYIADLNRKLSETGSAIHVGLDDVPEGELELYPRAEALIAAGGPVPEISISRRSAEGCDVYAAQAADELRKLGYSVRENTYDTPDLWDFSDAALKKELNEFICRD